MDVAALDFFVYTIGIWFAKVLCFLINSLNSVDYQTNLKLFSWFLQHLGYVYAVFPLFAPTLKAAFVHNFQPALLAVLFRFKAIRNF